MTKTFCDRCGKQIRRIEISNTIYPFYTIKETVGPGGQFVIDLCDQCTKELGNWLREEKSDV